MKVTLLVEGRQIMSGINQTWYLSLNGFNFLELVSLKM